MPSETVEMVRSRTLNDADLDGFGRRVADQGRDAFDLEHGAHRYMPSFRDPVAKAAAEMLKTVRDHERSMVLTLVNDWADNAGHCAPALHQLALDLKRLWQRNGDGGPHGQIKDA